METEGTARREQAESQRRHPAVSLAGMRMSADTVASKVPAVTLGFWIIKIAATTLGETGGDTLSMTFDLGYLVSTLIFASVLGILVACQIAAKKFHPFLYWATIIASTTAGTTLADFADRSLGIAYYFTRISRVWLFWAAFILTRPLGATVGDFFDKPIAAGGLNVSRPLASAIIMAFIILCLLVIPQRPGSHPGSAAQAPPRS